MLSQAKEACSSGRPASLYCTQVLGVALQALQEHRHMLALAGMATTHTAYVPTGYQAHYLPLIMPC